MVRTLSLPRRLVTATLLSGLVVVSVPSAPASAAPSLLVSGQIATFDVPTADALPHAMALDADGTVWFTERAADRLGRIAPDGTIVETALPEFGVEPAGIGAGPGGIWFTEASAARIGVLAGDGTLTEFPLPGGTGQPAGVAEGPDGAMWFTERTGHAIGRVNADGTIEEFPTTPKAGPFGIALGADGAIWFTQQVVDAIGRIDADGTIVDHPLADVNPAGIAPGPDGAMWFTERAGNAIGRIETDGTISSFPLPIDQANPASIAPGPDGAMWFTMTGADAIGRIEMDGTIQTRAIAAGAAPYGIVADLDGTVWWAEQGLNRIGRLTPADAPPDLTAPTIAISSPVEGTPVLAGSPVRAAYACTDEPGGSGIATCAGPVASGASFVPALGAQTFTVTASDVAGNTATASVTILAFSRIEAPLTGMLRPGEGVPFTLGMGLDPRSRAAVLAEGSPVSRQVDCADPSMSLGPATAAEVKPAHVRNDGSLSFRWRTDRGWAGQCRTLELRFAAAGWTGGSAVFLARFSAR